MAFQVLGLVLWSLVAIVGTWLLVTGRHMIFGLPLGTRKGWQVRAFGLIFCVAGTFLAFRAVEGSFTPEGIVFGYVVLGIAVWTAWRKARVAERSQQDS